MNTVQTVASFGSLEFIWSPQTATEKRRSEGLGLDPTAGPSAFALLKRVLVAMNYRPGPGAGLQKPSVEPFVLLFFFFHAPIRLSLGRKLSRLMAVTFIIHSRLE